MDTPGFELAISKFFSRHFNVAEVYSGSKSADPRSNKKANFLYTMMREIHLYCTRKQSGKSIDSMRPHEVEAPGNTGISIRSQWFREKLKIAALR